jgi:hypothetical protein
MSLAFIGMMDVLGDGNLPPDSPDDYAKNTPIVLLGIEETHR